MLSFRMIAMVYAAFCIAVGIVWFMDVTLYTATYGVDVGPAAAFFGQRVAPVVIGLGIMLYLARNEPPSPLRRILCIGVALVFGGVALTGLMAFATGQASFAILVAAATEIAAAALILMVAQDR